jgi:flagellar export protein FliJ
VTPPGSPFRFRLERIRALRERREEIARQELAKANTRLTDSQKRMRALDEHLERTRSDQREATSHSASVSGDELRDRQAFVERVESQRADHARDVACREQDVTSRTHELGKAARDHQMLERLKERRKNEHTHDQARQEAGVLDDMAIDRYRRRVA